MAECNALALGRVDPRFRTRQPHPMEKWPGFRTPSPRGLVESLATSATGRAAGPLPLDLDRCQPSAGTSIRRRPAPEPQGVRRPLLIRRYALTPALSILGPSGCIDAASVLFQPSSRDGRLPPQPVPTAPRPMEALDGRPGTGRGDARRCPSGQTSTHTRERQQVRSRDVFTHCPFGTTALPGPTYGGWSNWVDTGARRNEVNTCKPTAARCSDGSLQVVAWHSADGQDVPPPSGSSGISYWYPDTVVRLTPAEKAKLDWTINNVPIHRVETPAPMPGNWPANVSKIGVLRRAMQRAFGRGEHPLRLLLRF